MRTQNIMRHLAWGVIGLVSQQAYSPVTVPNNNGQGGAFVGWNANANQILEVKNEGNQPIQWYTDAARRMILSPTLTNQTVNGFTGLDLSGFLGIGNFNPGSLFSPHEPYALLHLDDWGLTPGGYRPWMRAGTLISKGSDMAFFGMKPGFAGATHTVVAWCDNSPADNGGPDMLKFIFSSHTGSGTGVAGTTDGLEAARFLPLSTGNASNFGLGDWFTAGTNPTERLDILDGRVRIRQLPDDAAAVPRYKVMVVDDSPAPSAERGVVKWVYPTALPGGAGCDWVVQNSGISGAAITHSVYSAVGSSDDCPDDQDAVGVGTSTPKAKLHVFTTDPAYFGHDVIAGQFRTDQSGGRAVSGTAGAALSTSFSAYALSGVLGIGENGKYSYGVDGVATIPATSSGSATDIIAVRGRARAYGNASRVVGVYGAGSGAIDSTNDWAAYFDGRGYLASGPWQPSDAGLKQNMEDLAPADMAAALMALQPKSYVFNTEEFPGMHLPGEVQRGLISQEVAAVFPDLVSEVIRPEQVDSTGNVIEPEVHFKAMNYLGLIPVLIAGFQHQQQLIDQQQATLLHMQEQLAACCAATNPGMAPGNGNQKTTPAEELKEQRLLIIPNPVADMTMLQYYVPKAGRVSLQVSTSDGKPLGSLREEQAEAGGYTYTWNTTQLAAGTYFCTLVVDGNVVVKRAVKVR